MKGWSVALLLGLLSVCRAAPLCDQLLTNENQGLDLSGRWYFHAMATDSCVFSNLMHNLLKPSIAMDFSLNESPNQYGVTYLLKTLSFCANETDPQLHRNQKDSLHLLKSCSDCIILKESTFLALLSRKTTMDVDDLTQFETLAMCSSLPRPQRFDTDYNFDNCKDLKNNEPTEEELTIMAKRFETFMAELGRCTAQYIWSWIQSYKG